ncbi:MAG: hypothetical protein E7052_07870 [Lentisphaerae bacterium]|nr:hypothetical protein [Lentisphaerota bacterium]
MQVNFSKKMQIILLYQFSKFADACSMKIQQPSAVDSVGDSAVFSGNKTVFADSAERLFFMLKQSVANRKYQYVKKCRIAG